MRGHRTHLSSPARALQYVVDSLYRGRLVFLGGRKVRFDRAHFQKYGDFALIFEIVYYVLSADYADYMDIQQAVNLEIYEVFEKEGIEFAYPTQTVYVNRADS